MSKDKIQKSVSVAGQRLADIVKMMELHGSELSEIEFNKVFAFLNATLATVVEKSQSARALAIASSGSFSFDMPIPVLPGPIHNPHIINNVTTLPYREPVAAIIQAPKITGATDGTRAVGRLVKEARSEDNPKGFLFDVPEKPAVLEEDPDDVTFISETKKR